MVAQAQGDAPQVGSLLDLPQAVCVTKICSVKVSKVADAFALHCSVTTILQGFWWVTQWWKQTMSSAKFVTITVFSAA